MKITFTLILFCVLSIAFAQQKTISRKDLQTALIEQKVKTVEIQEITFPAGQHAPEHLHPCPVVGYIKSGSARFQIAGAEPVILKAGESFYEPKDATILHFDNASENEELTFVAFYLKESNEEKVKLISPK
ncbi:cupin domain-containing protein [Dyadobacter sp. CY326]|uniref:cupin domain-containing protein n=1 Tax=Dyadobacter sp. CY326 TaxID=2907300 RepID=UPI001F2ACFF2|nr:cupin domain-containing protein [Dyadobacter sp. CY326]MCE7063862.1 cupin domain-containing protein [Dyadobacter sp. CY326]